MIAITSNATRGRVNSVILFNDFAGLEDKYQIKTQKDLMDNYHDLIEDYENSKIYDNIKKVNNPKRFKIFLHIEDGSRFIIFLYFLNGAKTPNIDFKKLKTYEVSDYNGFVVYTTTSDTDIINIHSRYVKMKNGNVSNCINYDVNEKFNEILFRAKKYYGMDFHSFNLAISKHCVIEYDSFIKDADGYYRTDDTHHGYISYDIDAKRFVIDLEGDN